MNHKTVVNIASFLRGIYPLKIKEELYATFSSNLKGQKANDLIKNILLDEKPVMISRFGNSELQTLVNYLEINSPKLIKYYRFITHQNSNIDFLTTNASFFPANPNHIEKYRQAFLDDNITN